ncbi:nickel-binding protein [Plesiocystis pacifica]|uniref:nickel-binding protein n=1 Tax=Plesiocystis pacifica TaxID=191768 RepID=UPI0022B74C12|nr:nickel-binding protein [Plesiocystis pacifica]
MTVHRAPGLLREQWVENASGVYAGEHARFVQAYVNLGSGFILTIYEAETAEALEEQFEELGLPFEEMHEVQFSQSFAEMEGMLKQMGKI